MAGGSAAGLLIAHPQNVGAWDTAKETAKERSGKERFAFYCRILTAWPARRSATHACAWSTKVTATTASTRDATLNLA